MTCFSALRGHLKQDSTAPTYEYTFSGASNDDWNDALTGNQTQSVDSTYVCTGSQSLKIKKTAAGSVNFAQDFQGTNGEDDPLDLTDSIGMLHWYAHDGMVHDSDLSDGDDSYFSTTGGMSVFLHDGTNQRSTVTYAPNTDNADGWKVTPIRVSDLTAGALNLNDIQRILIQLNTISVADYDVDVQEITFDRIAWYPKQKARLLIRFDDGYDDAYIWANTAKSNGFLINLACIPENWGNAGIMTREQTRELYRAGHCIINHCNGISGEDVGTLGGWRWTGSSKNTLTSQANREAAILAARRDLVVAEMPDFSDTVVVPGGSNHPSDEQLIADGHTRLLWYAGGGQPGLGGPTPRSWARGQHEWGLWADYTMDGKTKAQVKAEIDELISKGGDCCFFCHNNDADSDMWNNTSDGVAKYIGDKINSDDLEVITLRDLVQTNRGTVYRPVKSTVKEFVKTNI